MAQGKWTKRAGNMAQGLALAALAIAASGLTLARYDVIAKMDGFLAFLIGGAVAALAMLAGVAALILSLRAKGAGRRPALIGLVLAVPLVAFLATRPMAAGDAPPLHDITTNLANPPEFAVLPLRADNLVGVGTLDNWRAMHGAAYGDLQPLTLAQPVPAVMQRAQALAQERGWQIAAFDPQAGRLEATASVSYIRFKDDVIVTAEPAADGQGSVVNMRSVSRVGVGDLGVNARRIREFLEALAQDPAG